MGCAGSTLYRSGPCRGAGQFPLEVHCVFVPYYSTWRRSQADYKLAKDLCPKTRNTLGCPCRPLSSYGIRMQRYVLRKTSFIFIRVRIHESFLDSRRIGTQHRVGPKFHLSRSSSILKFRNLHHLTAEGRHAAHDWQSRDPSTLKRPRRPHPKGPRAGAGASGQLGGEPRQSPEVPSSRDASLDARL